MSVQFQTQFTPKPNSAAKGFADFPRNGAVSISPCLIVSLEKEIEAAQLTCVRPHRTKTVGTRRT
jgi:hypothetical protein